MENIYRLYTPIKDIYGKKIPYLPEKKTLKLIDNIKKNKSISMLFVVNIDKIKKNNKSVIIDINQDGHIFFHIEKLEIDDINDLNDICKDIINQVIKKIIQIFDPTKVIYDYFDSFYKDDIEILEVKYNLKFKSKKLDIKNNLKYFPSIFHEKDISKLEGDYLLGLNYKRVSNYDRLSDIDSIIVELINKQIDDEDIIQRCSDFFENYDDTKEYVDRVISSFRLDDHLEEEGEKKRIVKIKNNAGFGILFEKTNKNDIICSIHNVNDLAYMNFLYKYLINLITFSSNIYTKQDIDPYFKQVIKENIEEDIIVENEKEPTKKIGLSDLYKSYEKSVYQEKPDYDYSDYMNGNDDSINFNREVNEEEKQQTPNIKSKSPTIANQPEKQEEIKKTPNAVNEDDEIEALSQNGNKSEDESEDEEEVSKKTPNGNESEDEEIEALSQNGNKSEDESEDEEENEQEQEQEVSKKTPNAVNEDDEIEALSQNGNESEDESDDEEENEQEQEQEVSKKTPNGNESEDEEIEALSQNGNKSEDESEDEEEEQEQEQEQEESKKTPNGVNENGEIEALSESEGNSNSNEEEEDEESSKIPTPIIKSKTPNSVNENNEVEPLSESESNSNNENSPINGEKRINLIKNTGNSNKSTINSQASIETQNSKEGGVKDKNIFKFGQTNPFSKRLEEREPLLYVKEKKGKYKMYSRSCGWTNRRTPVIISQEEKDYIDKNFSGSYDEAVQYSTNPSKEKFWYICPRYWNLRDNVPVKPEDVDPDTVIEEDASEANLDKQFIFEFTKNGKYTKKFPSFLESDKHEHGLYMPCCYKLPEKGEDDSEALDAKARIKEAEEQMKLIEESGLTEEEDILDLLKGQKKEKGLDKKTKKKEDDYIKQGNKFPLGYQRKGHLPLNLENLWIFK